MNPTVGQIIDAIEAFAPRRWQESFDNSGWQILLPGAEQQLCTGALLCVDATPGIVAEAKRRNCNLLLTHHPLLFHGLKRISGDDRVGLSVIEAIRQGVSIYSCHTPVDLAPEGVSYNVAKILGLEKTSPLQPGTEPSTGLGVVGEFNPPITFHALIELIKEKLHTPVARCSNPLAAQAVVSKIAIGGGACADLLPAAIARGAQVMITSDVKHNYFIDYAHAITVVDLGHYETEVCTKEIFYNVIREKFPNFVPYYSQSEQNPINYL